MAAIKEGARQGGVRNMGVRSMGVRPNFNLHLH